MSITAVIACTMLCQILAHGLKAKASAKTQKQTSTSSEANSSDIQQKPREDATTTPNTATVEGSAENSPSTAKGGDAGGVGSAEEEKDVCVDEELLDYLVTSMQVGYDTKQHTYTHTHTYIRTYTFINIR